MSNTIRAIMIRNAWGNFQVGIRTGAIPANGNGIHQDVLEIDGGKYILTGKMFNDRFIRVGANHTSGRDVITQHELMG